MYDFRPKLHVKKFNYHSVYNTIAQIQDFSRYRYYIDQVAGLQKRGTAEALLVRGIGWSLRAFASVRALRFIAFCTSSDHICLASREHFRNSNPFSIYNVVLVTCYSYINGVRSLLYLPFSTLKG